MDPKQHPDGLAGLLEDVLAADGPSPELLARYAEDPGQLSGEERSLVEEAAARSGAVADQLRVIESFDPARLDPAPAPAPAEPARDDSRAGGLAPLRRFIEALVAPPGVWVPVAAAAALLVALLSVRVADEAANRNALEAELAATLRSLDVLQQDLARVTQESARQAQRVAALRQTLADREGQLAAALGKLESEAPPVTTREPEVRSAPQAEKLAQSPAPEEPAPAAAPSPPPPVQVAMNEAPVYEPPAGIDTGLAPSRSSGRMRSAGVALPRIEALAPDHVGQTISVTPTLYWQLSERTDRDIVVTLVDPRAQKTLLDVRLPGPHRRGVGRLRLANRGVRLSLGTTYQWFVSVLAGETPGPDDAVAGGLIERVEKSSQLDAALRRAGAARAVHVYARGGLWYDAIDSISRVVAASPRDPAPRAQRDALLEQVGLSPGGR